MKGLIVIEDVGSMRLIAVEDAGIGSMRLIAVEDADVGFRRLIVIEDADALKSVPTA
ncbi:hypothetical protein [uncultured Duncaniella sp.]|uniref:hypothetical protein n=1 Tax=uncultured Duncaniella sp. TaxID=2768039 RepID=UPI0025FD1784|nr:hypothetical protein [uncultured Duncaniella sp.]